MINVMLHININIKNNKNEIKNIQKQGGQEMTLARAKIFVGVF